MGTPRDLLDRISRILNEKSDDDDDDDVKVLIAIDRELKDVDYMNEWSPRDAAYWAIRPQSKKEARLHAFIEDHGYMKGLKWGLVIGGVVGALVATMWR
jgi:hypothetical protein